MKQSICLNLHEKYAPDWAVWEVARELYANARDADAEGMKVRVDGPDVLEIRTATAPHAAELFIIGCGSKRPGGETIGQFGEGLKLAALVATRAGGSLELRLPQYKVTFALREYFGEQVLFADLEDARPRLGYLCRLTMPGAGEALEGRVIEGQESRAIPKNPDDPVKIYCKGIFITELQEPKALNSYNLNSLKLNRDRSHAEPWSIKCAVAEVLADNMTEELAETLIGYPMSWESDECLATLWPGLVDEDVKERLAYTLIEKHGHKAIISTDTVASSQARELGYRDIQCGDGLVRLLEGRVPTDVQIMSKQRDLVEAPGVPPDGLHELERLAGLVGLRGVTVAIFEDKHGDLMGKADTANKLIWMNQRLFLESNRFERIRTFIHELGHIQSGATDASYSFEASLDLIGAKLAVHVLDGGILQ